MEYDSEKVEEVLSELYEYTEYLSGDKLLAVKLAIKLIEHEHLHENNSIIHDDLLVDLIEESRLHQKTIKSIEKQSFFKALSSPTSETSISLPKILSTKHSVLDYFATPVKNEIIRIADNTTELPSSFQSKPTIWTGFGLENKSIDVESMPKKEEPAKITHVGGALESGIFQIFCDGACKNNGKKYAKGGYGISVQHNNKEIYIVSKALEDSEAQTNNRAELHALSDALEIAYKKINYLAAKSDIHVKKVNIYSDSQYSINCLTKWSSSWSKRGWRKADGDIVENLDIVKPMFEDWSKWNMHTNGILYDIQIHHVRSHTGKSDPISLGNERADELAVLSIS